MTYPTLRLAIVCFATATLTYACAPETAGERVPVRVMIESNRARQQDPLAVELKSGWTVHLEKASLSLGPIYLRSPRREGFSAWRWLVPTAHAHGGHAQTLTEGQVIGEVLRSVSFDALAGDAQQLDDILVESTRLDRLSVMLMPPQGAAVTGGRVATVRGWAEREEQRVDFDCGLDIEQDGDETPENLAERRRVDQIRLDGAPTVTTRDTLVLRVHAEAWLERVDFDALVGVEDPCPRGLSSFAAQWYLGLRRPEAFSAQLVREEQ